MQILYSLLPKDYFLITDFLSFFNLNLVYPIKYKIDLNFLLNFDKEKELLGNMLGKFNNELSYKIMKVRDNFKVKNDDFKIESDYDLLYNNDDYNDEIVISIKKFYKKYYNQEILVDNNNIIEILDSEINFKDNIKLAKDYKKICQELFYETNSKIIKDIIGNFKNKLLLNNLSYDDNTYRYLVNKLFIFFRVVGRDFIKLIDEPIQSDDSFALIFAKINKLFFRVARMEILDLDNFNLRNVSLIKNEELLIILFFLCMNCDYNGSLIDNISKRFSNKEKNYCKSSIEINNQYKYLFS